MSKPTNKPNWTSNNVSEPSSIKKSQGWATGEKPSAAQMNWLLKTISQWIDHVDLDQVKGETGDVGPSGSKGQTGDAGPVGLKGEIGDAGPVGLKGQTGDVGPQGPDGSGSLSATDEARLANLESIINVSTSASVSAGIPYSGQALNETLSVSSTIDWSVSLSQRIVLSGNSTLSFTNGISGKVYFLSIQQPSGGSATVTWPGNVTWNNGPAPVLSTGGNRKDIIGFYFDGSNYIGYSIAQFQNLPVLQSGSETKNGYVAGGIYGNGTTSSSVSTVEKMNLNNDLFSIVQTEYGLGVTSTGSTLFNLPNLNYQGQGTQSSVAGYRHISYNNNWLVVPASGGTGYYRIHKLLFATDTTTTGNIAPTYASGSWIQTTRKGIVQSAIKAYIPQNGGSGGIYTFTGSLTFSTDTIQNQSNQIALGITAANDVNQNIRGYGLSASTHGVFWGMAGGTTGYKLQFSTETFSGQVASSVSVGSTNYTVNEAVDSEFSGYFRQYQQATSTNRYHKINKETDSFTELFAVLPLNNGRTGSSAFQGNSVGYFCGGNRATATTNTALETSLSYNDVIKITYSSETISTHGASLTSPRSFAAGFEG